MFHNFVKVAAAVPNVHIGCPQKNADEALALIKEAEERQVEIVCFPELSLTGYTCGDMFFNSSLLDNAEKAMTYLLEATKDFHIVAIVGMPLRVDNRLYNCGVVIKHGKIWGIVPKAFLPNNNEFYEHRWFSSGLNLESKEVNILGYDASFGEKMIFQFDNYNFSLEICEDLWSVIPPSSYQALAGSHIIFNLSASNELVGKNTYRKSLVVQQSGRCVAGYVYASAGFGESSTDVLFASSALIAENGSILAESDRFVTDSQLVISEIDVERIKFDRLHNDSFKQCSSNKDFDICSSHFYTDCQNEQRREFALSRIIGKHPFVPQGRDLDNNCQEIFSIQSNALAIRMKNAKISYAVIGISGGLDSTLALLVTVEAFQRLGLDKSNIIGVTMPGFGTTSRTKSNSLDLMERLGVTSRTIPINKAVGQHFSDISHNPEKQDITYENSQARERTQILMDIANQVNGLVIGTGDMSELALGWCTYNGDHMSMYAVNSGVPKTLVKHLVDWIAQNRADISVKEILEDIVDTPISPELLPAKDDKISQKTEDFVGPYELHDFFLYYFLRFGFSKEKILFLAQKAFEGDYADDVIKKWLDIFYRRFFTQQFKRSCIPDGVKVGSVNLSPRGDLRMPSDMSSEEF